jgi:hypothetical protein
VSDDFDGGRILTPRTGPAGDTPPEDTAHEAAHIAGNWADDDALAREQMFEETGDGVEDNVGDAIPRHSAPVLRSRMLVQRVALTSSSAPQMLFPEHLGRVSITVTSDGSGVRMAEQQGEISLGNPLPKLTSDNGTAVTFYDWTGAVWVDAPTASGTVNVTAYAVIPL